MSDDTKTKQLTPKQEKFARGYASGLSGAEAIRQAGYNPGSTTAASVHANKLKKHEGVNNLIQTLLFRDFPDAPSKGIARMLQIIESGRDSDAIAAFKTLVQLSGLEPKKVTRSEKLVAQGKPSDFKLPTE